MKQVAYSFEFDGGFGCGLAFGVLDEFVAPVGGFSVNADSRLPSVCALLLFSLLAAAVEVVAAAALRLQLAN